jgi:hypothetical protein
MSKLTMVEQTTAPDTPGTNQVVIYPNTNGEICTKNDAGTVRTYAPSNVAPTFTEDINVRPHTVVEGWSIDAAHGTPVTLANTVQFQFSPAKVFSGLVIVTNGTGGQGAVFMCAGGVVVEMADGGNVYSVTKNTGSSTNLHYESGEYLLQNNTGSEGVYYIFSIRLRASS